MPRLRIRMLCVNCMSQWERLGNKPINWTCQGYGWKLRMFILNFSCLSQYHFKKYESTEEQSPGDRPFARSPVSVI